MAVYVAYGRVTYEHPGKHGTKDIKVEFAGKAPTHAETLAILWGLFHAEDRYDEEWHEGRAMLKRFVDAVYDARTFADAKEIISRSALR